MSILSYLSKRYVLVFGGIAVLALAGSYVVLQGPQDFDTAGADDDQQTIGSELGEGEPSVSVKAETTGGAYTIEMVPMEQGSAPVYPSLDRKLSFPASYSEEAKKIMTDKINATVAALKKDPNQYGEWANLGIFRNGINDWEGARQIWEFLTVMSPSQPAPFANLANLYAFSLKDPVRAEANLKKAIEKGPLEMSVYRLGYEFYRFVRKDDGLAKDMLNQGIAKTDSVDLKYLRDHYDEL